MWIKEIRVEGGMLNGFEQRLDPQLNVLIGGRGTGKSSVIELIRFCLGATSYTESGQQDATEHALGVLGDGRVVITMSDGQKTSKSLEPLWMKTLMMRCYGLNRLLFFPSPKSKPSDFMLTLD